MIRSILVPLIGPTPRIEALDAGIALCHRFAACLDAFHPALDPTASAAYLGEGTTGALIETVVEAAEEESNRRIEAAQALFKARVAQANLPPERVRFVADRGRDTDLVTARARAADLTVLSQAGVRSDPSTAAIWESLLYESGRPVLLVPENRIAERLAASGSVLIAWTESPEAARAVAFAEPFWAGAASVTAVSISGHKLKPLVDYGARHDTKIETRPLAKVERGALEDGTGEAILQIATELGADLIVMGAYTHGRLRRFIMGGATRTVVDNAALPVLMAH